MSGEPNIITKPISSKSGIDGASGPNEQTLTMFGHQFTISDMRDIASFITRLQEASDHIEERGKLPDGSIFILKITGKEAQVSLIAS